MEKICLDNTARRTCDMPQTDTPPSELRVSYWSAMRYAAKVDTSQKAIVDALRAVGATVHFIGQPVDLIVGFRGTNFIFECKSGEKKRDDLTDIQIKFRDTWRGQFAVICSPAEALAAIGCLKIPIR